MDARAIQILKALSDESRLRILGVLRHEPLNVNEILSVLEMGQSRVSRHLKILADAGLLERIREGSHIYYSLLPALSGGSGMISGILQSLGLLNGSPLQNRGEESDAYARTVQRDQQRLGSLLESRKSAVVSHFQSGGLEQEKQQQGLVDADYYRKRVVELGSGVSGIVVDLGSGTGELAAMMTGEGRKLICVDQSPAMLDRSRVAVGSDQAEFRLGSLEHLPLRDGEADVVIASMVLHHIPDPIQALLEMRRVLRKGGILILADLVHHSEEVMRSKFADFWLGFERRRLKELVEKAFFEPGLSETGSGKGKLECIFMKAVAKRETKSGDYAA